MQLGALGLAIAMILFFPAIPWIVFPGRRKAGAVAAVVATGVCGAWVLKTFGTEGLRFVTFVFLCCAVRVGAETVGAFDQGRAVRAHRATCDDAKSCGVDHQTDRFTYLLVAFLAITGSLVLYFAWR
ncbi:hypothetical protein ABZ791_37890 [Streptomyces huasconensis]|uniref:Uncharacterized protein n=1 Tax=Streptomyces huasconensis TaxID=1854574 RepID=A0ABV3M782_9ACTN